MFRRAGVRVEPSPPVEGQLVTITVAGPGPWYVATNPTGELVEVRPDTNGEVEIRTPASAGGSFTVTNAGDPAVPESFDVVGPSP